MEEQLSVTSFVVAGEYFAFDTIKIEHILERFEPTPVPLTKEYILGIINNHGNMIPVVDFRRLIGVAEATEELPEASIIVASVDGTHESLVGFLVDQVDQVIAVEEEMIKKEVVLRIDKEVQPSVVATIQHEGRFIYRMDLEELTKVIAK